ncbi:MAG: glycoside hydrolase family 97 catalytic domain-containing protein [Prevotella sp.]|nr:glycoside hydrolase family 97 catalytic domain-containing protein [Prevotella sp.]
MRKLISILLICWATAIVAQPVSVQSPDGRLTVTVSNDNHRAWYEVTYDGVTAVQKSGLGLKTNIGDLTEELTMTSHHSSTVTDCYEMDRVKASHINYEANRIDVDFINAQGLCMTVVFQVSNNNVAFCYQMPRPEKNNPKCAVIYSEASAFRLPDATTTFLSPQINAMAGWERTKPSYEEDYEVEQPMQRASKFGEGYTFPCLFKIEPSLWLLISETGVSSSYCASHLSDFKPDEGYTIAFPMEGENNGVGSAFAAVSLPAQTPWRTITVGTDLAPIVETTIAYDVVKPLYEPSKKYEGGRYTWSWLIWQDQSINYDDQVKFIDLASAMGIEYCLVDNWWDTQIGRERIAELSRYAQSKGVRLMLWYNSNGYSNDAPQTPRDCMSTAIAREREMKWLRSIGVVGIKVDFLGSDKQETMRLYEDILSDANRYGLQVIFHGCTIPRGWERMYPNYVASEAALASENVFFSEGHARTEGFELTIHPFCRNTLGAFDWGGVIMNRYISKDNKSRHPRYTSDVFEMATGITNQTLVQCIAMQPNNLNELPQFEMDFIRQLPTQWDETRFIDGYPSRYVVLARRHGNDWYVAGLNGTDRAMTLTLQLPMLAGKTVSLYTDNPKRKGEIVSTSVLKQQKIGRDGNVKLTIQPMGGIILK